jgi:glutathione peroxidase
MGFLSSLISRLTPDAPVKPVAGSVFDFKIRSLQGKEIDLNAYRGKKLLLVNTASRCGYTYQYEDLQKLHEQYGNQVAVVGFPANNFLWQEPGTNDDIASFCEVNYGVTFPLSEKISVKGRDKHPLYQWLQNKTGKTPSWNFCKYLFDEQGNFLGFYPPTVKPMDPEIVEKIKV